MKLVAALLLVGSFSTTVVKAQSYQVTTDKTDSFSLALVKLMNCATGRFKDCKGDSLRTTSLMGTDHRLAIHFPGSAMAVVRSRDWDVNAYVEFRGYRDNKTRDQGIRELVAKIKNALGDQLFDPYENRPGEKIYFRGLSVKDANGYFSMNMELFGGSSSAPLYLLGPEQEDDKQPKDGFILLKIYPGIPNYQYYIRPVIAPDQKLDETLRQLLQAATGDFVSMRLNNTDSSFKKIKKRDSLQMNGFEVFMNYRGSNYTADLRFPAAADTVVKGKQWVYYQQALQAALGTEYVYHLYGSEEKPSIVYYKYGHQQPTVYLSLEKEYNEKIPLIIMKIVSAFSHETKRSLERDDL